MEADLHVDDVVIDFADGTRAFMQAKLGANKREFEATIDQWCRAITSGECRRGDELFLVVARNTQDRQSLADALSARRNGASLTDSAERQIQELRQLAADRGLDAPATQRLLDAAAIRTLDVRDSGRDEALGAACLNSAVVPAGYGQAAFRALRAAARAQAEQRSSSELATWRSWLAQAQLPLIADAAGTAAARLEALEQALHHYRKEWAQRQDVLPLADLGLGLTSMTVPGMTERLRAIAHTQNRARSQLASVVRRQGRLFLVGRPGAGKTVASRAITARWAANERAPVPVWLRLRDLIPLLPAAGPYRIDARDLLRTAIGDHQPLLTEALLEHMEQGNALLVLDALDETLDRQDTVVEALADLLDRLPDTLDVLVTSRHSCLQSATLLRLPVYGLEAPANLDDTLDRLLDAVAERLGGDTEGAQRQEVERRARIARSRRAEPSLWSVPLLATFMVMLIAQRPASAVPSRRAALLEEVIDNSVRLWEMRRAAQPVPDTAPELTADVLIDCFDDIARLVARDGSTLWRHAHDAVSRRLQNHWGKPPGAAAAAARSILEYWDATAAVFISDGPQGTLSARTRLFAEIGEARWAVRSPRDLAEWMSEVADQRPESARLAASLSPAAADALIAHCLQSGGNSLNLIHNGIRDGAHFDEASLHAQLERLDITPDCYPPARPGVFSLSKGRSPRAQLIVRLANEDLDEAQADRLMAAAAALGPRLQAVIAALRVQHQAHRRGAELTEGELDVLQEALERIGAEKAEHEPTHAHGSNELARAVVTHLLPRRPQSAPTLMNIGPYINVNTMEWLEVELTRLGHPSNVKTIPPAAAEALIDFARRAQHLPALFELLAQLDDQLHALTPAQAWHLDETVAFIDALDLDDFPALTAPTAARLQPQLTRRILCLAFEAYGCDSSLISTQIRSLKLERPERVDWGLLYISSTRNPAAQPTATVTVDDDLLLKVVQYGNAWLVSLTLKLAAATPPNGHRLAERLVTYLPSLNPQARLQAAVFLASRWPALALPEDDAVVRAATARLHAATLASSRRHQEAETLLTDADLLVRQEAARFLTDIPPAELPLLEQALARPAQQWTCFDCGTTLAAETDVCARSHPRPTPGFPDLV
ncbi:NACHT domain-containing protein [Streptomyces sp. NPDC127066]|uniref:NACHT domain-containing protein n=1 Tax=Streptomyces sp. NPDC127066 TaxID=3347125 RepID=UPI003660C03C